MKGIAIASVNSMKIKLYSIIVLTSLLAAFCLPATAYAHGVKIEYTTNMTIELVAKFDSGEPMPGAQVTIYAPNDPSTPWLTGTCDDEGYFKFTPDSAIPGTWDVQVRQAGHGHIIHIPLGEGELSSGSSSGYSTAQIVVMAACVIWGILATALYLKGRKT